MYLKMRTTYNMVRICFSLKLFRLVPKAYKTVVFVLGALLILNASSSDFLSSQDSLTRLRALSSGFQPVMWCLTSRISESFDDASLIDAVATSMGSLRPGSPRPHVLLTRWEPSNSERRTIAVNSTAPSAIEQEVTLLAVIHGTTKDQPVVRAPTNSAQNVIHLLSQFQLTLLPYPPGSPRIVGYVDGLNPTLTDSHQLIAVLEEKRGLFEAVVSDHGVFHFPSTVPDGQYLLSIRGDHYFTEPARTIDLQPTSEPAKVVLFRVRPIENAFIASSAYRWRQDGTLAGHEIMSDKPEHLVPRLADVYNIILCENSTMPWSRDLATRLVLTLDSIPLIETLGTTHWNLTDGVLFDHDIKMQRTRDNVTQVVISKDAFMYAQPQVPDRPKEAFFSKRLYVACIHFVINNAELNSTIAPAESSRSRRGRRLAYILLRRFGVTVSPDAIDYEALTRLSTEEDRESFQAFSTMELISIVTMFEEMPHGLHKLPNLHTLVRRKTGLRHPTYPSAIALAHTAQGYIEFMGQSFGFRSSAEEVFGCILHEKAHFLYVDSTIIPMALKLKWIGLGGWYVVYDEHGIPEEWTTKEEHTFVSSYAHERNPGEDFAESFEAYIRRPLHLQARAPKKYDFLRDHVVNGVQYELRYRENLTFQVFNLYPDVDPVGRVKDIAVVVRGDDDADKTIHVRINITNVDGKNDSATRGDLSLMHETDAGVISKHIFLHPVNQEKMLYVLEGETTLSRYAPSGDWTMYQLVLTDDAGNKRYVRVKNYSWKCVVKNVLADSVAPSYISHSLTHDVYDGRRTNEQLVKVKWFLVEDHMKTSGCYVALQPPHDPTQSAHANAIEKWGTANETAQPGTHSCEVVFSIPPYYRSGKYQIGSLLMDDLAGYRSYQSFHSTRTLDSEGRYLEPPYMFDVQTASPDLLPPRINPNSIRISARRRHPRVSNGETIVSLSVDICDVGGAGVEFITYSFADPLGCLTSDDMDHANKFTWLFQGDPEEWKSYNATHILPKGSRPGFWALHSLRITDKARNVKRYSFVESVQSYTTAEDTDGLDLIGPEEPHVHEPTKTNETVKCRACSFWLA